MPAPAVRVFVSSTWLDLQPERKAIEGVAQQMTDVKFVGMEYFGGRDETTHRASLDEVDRSDIYVGIFAARYGSGITEAEYRRARERGLHCRVYFKARENITLDKTEADPARTALLDKLKEELRREHTVVEFTTPEDLAAKVTADLYRLLAEEFPPTAPAISARHQLRAPVGDFVGREKEIATLVEALRGGSSAGISGISGMGGIGKTELALYVANQIRDDYPDAQLFVDMRGTDERPRDPADALADCVRAFVGLEQRLPEALEDLLKLYRAALDGKRALILLDNARDAAQVRPLLPPPGSALLVTSRETIPVPGMKRLTLEQLQPAEARDLLTRIAPRVPAYIADQICYLCGHLPLAVRAAASLLDVTADLDPAAYATQLADERTRLQRLGTEGVDLDVEASISLSYQRLTPDAARVFRQLSIFPATFDAPAEEAVCQDPNHTHLSDLLRRNLVLYNPDTRRYRLHDLLRLYADARLTEEERKAARMRHAVHYLIVLRECEECYLQGGETVKTGVALFDTERRHIEAGQGWACEQSHFSGDKMAAQLCSAYASAGGYILDLRQHPRESILWRESALAAARRLNDRGEECRHLDYLGITRRSLGDPRGAIEFHERALGIVRETGDRHLEVPVLGNLGSAYLELGELRRAIGFYEQALVIAREIGYRRTEGHILTNLGVAFKRLGEYQRAIEFHEQALVVVREVGDRHNEAGALGNLGAAYYELNEPQRAIEFHRQQLAIAREIGDIRGQGTALSNIGLVLNQLDDRSQAIIHAEAALEIFEQIESPSAARVRALLTRWRGEGG